jgi:deazaflavin-dependent oxidoreductase (nitroreductase family)
MTETPQSIELPGWIQDHVRRYLASDGEDGHMWDASSAGGAGVFPTLLLTTTGRQSGEPRLLPLIYGTSESDHVIIASKGGFPQHPAWYLNLVAEPSVDLQVGSEKFRARARTAQGEERTRLWDDGFGLSPVCGIPGAGRSRDSGCGAGARRSLVGANPALWVLAPLDRDLSR